VPQRFVAQPAFANYSLVLHQLNRELFRSPGILR
jgi:hypothetical protein